MNAETSEDARVCYISNRHLLNIGSEEAWNDKKRSHVFMSVICTMYYLVYFLEVCFSEDSEYCTRMVLLLTGLWKKKNQIMESEDFKNVCCS